MVFIDKYSCTTFMEILLFANESICWLGKHSFGFSHFKCVGLKKESFMMLMFIHLPLIV